MRILVLGGSGFIGSRVTRRLAEHEHELRVVHRGRTEARLPPAVEHVLAPFGELSSQLALLAAWRPEVVLDMVPYIDKQGHGVLRFRGVAARAVVVSSCDVYRAFARLWRSEPGDPDPVPLTETSPLRKTRAPDIGVEDGIDYDNLELERAVRGDPELPVTVLRLPATYGPGDPQHRLAAYVKRMADARAAIPIDSVRAHWRWTRGYVDNVAAAIALAIEDERASGETYNVASLNTENESAWIRRIGNLMAWSGEIVPVAAEKLPLQLQTPHDYRQDFVVDSSKLRNALGYSEVIDEAEGLAATVAWQRNNLPDALLVDYAAEDKALQT